MARKSRLFIQGMPHLVQLRGHNREPLFREDDDYSAFTHAMDLAARRYGIAIYGWSLAPERILILLTAEDKHALGRFIQHIGRSYVPFYNRRYQRRGALWDNRYCCSPLEANAYFLMVKRFVECNEDGICGRHSFGAEPSGAIVLHPIWMQLGSNPDERLQRYRDFCRTAMSPALVERICRALDQNCLLATMVISQQLEKRLERPLHARHIGRPRKLEQNPVARWTWLEQQAEHFLQQYGYQQIRLSMLERDPLFAPGGPALQGNGELRGDGTTGCLRIVAGQHSDGVLSRLWYTGVMFRQSLKDKHIQQNHQVGVEAFGAEGIDIELEHLMMQACFYRRLGIADRAELHLNTLGDAQDAEAYRQALRAFYQPVAQLLAPEQQAWLVDHPEWLVYHDDILLQRLAPAAPQHADFISTAARERFLRLQQALNRLGIVWQHAPDLFPRNQYCQLVFEWRSTAFERNVVLSRGGRYDACASKVVGRQISAFGFAFILESIMSLLSYSRHCNKSTTSVDIVIIPEQPRVAPQALLLTHKLRQQFPRLSIVNDSSTLRLTTRLKNSQRSGARFTLQLEGNGQTIQFFDAQTQGHGKSSVEKITEILSRAIV
ncbi:ATP phosphoribosyltransferase regulatory subunit [uncultured Pluralibacter sp.]|uniref:ATP phosphoribosyltransferase regulatory subunit n=1 Tax=uncultured Pluralibacter sp. TaxID=1490864 RepID=UPI00261813DB|nr:ATP phosphoribosyltransferase regulatory subunit [uncultured Pluralibacter sp.]